jgi:hypothetical protein
MLRKNKQFKWVCEDCDGNSETLSQNSKCKIAKASDKGSIYVTLENSKTEVVEVSSSPGTDGENDAIKAKYLGIIKPTVKNEGTNDQTNKLKEIKVCSYYMRNMCRHGMSGKSDNGCRFLHPKRCKKFMEGGWYACKSAKSCNLFHPRVCNNSFRYMFCNEGDCNELHIKNTKTVARGNISNSCKIQENRERMETYKKPRENAPENWGHNHKNANTESRPQHNSSSQYNDFQIRDENDVGYERSGCSKYDDFFPLIIAIEAMVKKKVEKELRYQVEFPLIKEFRRQRY